MIPSSLNRLALVTCVIVCFNAGKKLARIVSLILEQVNDVIIVDNDSNKETKLMLGSLMNEFPGRVTVIFNDKNYWFGKGMNIGIESAISKGAEYILQLNDDNYLSKNSVEIMLKCFETFSDKPIGIVSPRVLFDETPPSSLINEIRDEPLIASAGMLIPSEVFKKIGFYDEDLVIGYDDYDLSLRAIAHGYRCLAVSQACLHASLGRMQVRRVLWKDFMVFHYSSLRRYYAARNGLFLLKRWKSSRELLSSVFLWERNSILGVILFEEKKLEKIYLTLLGYFDALRGKMGFKS